MEGIIAIFFSTARGCHHIWLILVNTLIPQITKICSYDQTRKMIVNLGNKKIRKQQLLHMPTEQSKKSVIHHYSYTP